MPTAEIGNIVPPRCRWTTTSLAMLTEADGVHQYLQVTTVVTPGDYRMASCGKRESPSSLFVAWRPVLGCLLLHVYFHKQTEMEVGGSDWIAMLGWGRLKFRSILGHEGH